MTLYIFESAYTPDLDRTTRSSPFESELDAHLALCSALDNQWRDDWRPNTSKRVIHPEDTQREAFRATVLYLIQCRDDGNDYPSQYVRRKSSGVIGRVYTVDTLPEGCADNVIKRAKAIEPAIKEPPFPLTG